MEVRFLTENNLSSSVKLDKIYQCPICSSRNWWKINDNYSQSQYKYYLFKVQIGFHISKSGNFRFGCM